MVFDEEDWKRRLGKAQTQEEFAALIMELPERESHETKKESEEDGREFYLLEGRTPVRCYDEREVDFFVPIYDKIGKDCIHGIQSKNFSEVTLEKTQRCSNSLVI